MLIAMTLTCLFVIAALATGFSLLDSWLRGRMAFAVLQRERRLLNAGFVPQVQADEPRLRQPQHRKARRATAPTRRRSFGGAPRSQLGAIQALR